MATISEKINRVIKTAHDAGCPKDQTATLIKSLYYPLPWQWQFHAAAREADEEGGPVDIGLGGARGPGKSHAVLSQTAIDDCQRVAGLKCLFLRYTGAAAKESFNDLVTKVLQGHLSFRRTADSIRLQNGSKIILGGFRDERDIDKYIGIEYDIIIVEELNQITKERYMKLRGSLRTSKPNWRPRMYTSFNPGGIGHTFVKERYVIPWRENKQTETRFIPSTYKSNPYLNKEYNQYLETLDGDLGRAWREGEWDLFAGQYFSQWRFDKHVCDPFTIPLHYKRFRSIDPSGQSGATSCHWYAVDQDGRVWCYREHYGTGLDADQHADKIRQLSLDRDGVEEEYIYTVIDGAAFAKTGYSETIADVYIRHGVRGLIQAHKERVTGWNSVNFYLRWQETKEDAQGNKTVINKKPLLQIFSTCVKMIETIPELQHDDKNPEDVKSQYTGSDHQDCADDLRYFLRTLQEQHAPKKLSIVEQRIANMKKQESLDYSYRG